MRSYSGLPGVDTMSLTGDSKMMYVEYDYIPDSPLPHRVGFFAKLTAFYDFDTAFVTKRLFRG